MIVRVILGIIIFGACLCTGAALIGLSDCEKTVCTNSPLFIGGYCLVNLSFVFAWVCIASGVLKLETEENYKRTFVFLAAFTIFLILSLIGASLLLFANCQNNNCFTNMMYVAGLGFLFVALMGVTVLVFFTICIIQQQT